MSLEKETGDRDAGGDVLREMKWEKNRRSHFIMFPAKR